MLQIEADIHDLAWLLFSSLFYKSGSRGQLQIIKWQWNTYGRSFVLFANHLCCLFLKILQLCLNNSKTICRSCKRTAQ